MLSRHVLYQASVPGFCPFETSVSKGEHFLTALPGTGGFTAGWGAKCPGCSLSFVLTEWKASLADWAWQDQD